MSETNAKMNKKNTYELLEDYLKKENLIFYKREEKEIVIFLLPYRFRNEGKTYTVRIEVRVSNKSTLCRIGFRAKLNLEKEFEKELLAMNSELIDGNLSVASNSDKVSFVTSFSLTSETDIEKIYKKHLYKCLSVLVTLYDREIIKKEEKDESKK